ncbi:hypothetical protein MHU86_532 [Fragilaria crotonensis]|nr:hypothetical protein MHU86_532 [Fragilaria crotonensis]
MADHNGDDLASIHREALRKILLRNVTTNSDDPELSVLQDNLVALRKRRLELYTNLQELQFCQQLVPLSQEIKIRNSSHHGTNADSQREVATVSSLEHSSGCEPSEVPPLAERMHSLRKRRRIVGSHRIAGISIIPGPDPNVLGIRLDISIEGRYAAKHFFFLDIVGTVSGDDGEETDSVLYLRLVQHTLPSGILLKGIIQRHFGGTMLPLDNQVLTLADMATVRNLAGDIYDACYANAVRKEGVSFLKKYCDETAGNYAVHHLAFAETLRHVNFEVSLKMHARFVHNMKLRRIVVKLEYGEETNPQPTSVHVSEDGEYRDSKILIQKSMKILRTMPLWKFFDELDGET